MPHMRISTGAVGLRGALPSYAPPVVTCNAPRQVAVTALATSLPSRPRQEAPAEGPSRPRSVEPEALERFAERRISVQEQELEHLRNNASVLPGMPVEKMALAGYLLARHVDGRPAEGEDLARLDLADDTLIETRRGLRVGRGNVDVDIQRTGHESTQRVRIARSFAEVWSSTPERHPRIAMAATALFVQAGNCGDHASVALSLHAGKLSPGETANLVKPSGIDHEFVEIRTTEGREHDVVIDAWGDGPVIMATDGRFSSGSPEPFLCEYRDDSGAAVAADLDQRLGELQEIRQFELEMHLDLLRYADVQHPAEHVFAPTRVESDAFLQRVAEKMETIVKPGHARAAHWMDACSNLLQRALGRNPKRDRMAEVRHEILAVGISRILGDEVRSAVEDAPAVVREARSRFKD